MTTPKLTPTIHDAYKVLMACDQKIKGMYRYSCGIERMELSKDETMYSGFFSSPDYQNSALLSELRSRGFQLAGYEAAYYWKVRRGKVYIAYTEGDVSIFEVTVK